MSVLGSVGQLYMFVLLILLFLGSGFAVWSFINFVTNRSNQKSGAPDKKTVASKEVSGSNKNNVNKQTIGGLVMNNNGWLKLAVFSFVGILVSVIVLGFVSTSNPAGANIHQQHQQQGNMQMGNMQMQGGMNGNMGMQMNNGMMQNNNMMQMQQQLNQMQMQLNQMQQQMGMMNGGMGGMNNMGNMSGSQMQQGGMGMMGGMMNGMMGGMMNMGGMSGSGSMPQNNGSMSMPQNGNSGSSSGGMAGMGMM